jgi:glutamyl-Q tRNA(Asp) synthetase
MDSNATITVSRIFPEIINIVHVQRPPALLSFRMTTVRTRFAPSVTGHLHLGHALNAVHVWGIAQARGGEVIIRLEDHDRNRFRPEYEESILADLEWLGLNGGRTRQSDNHTRYRTAAERLSGSGHAYFCDCARKRCNGHCRERGLTEGVLRFRVTDGTEQFEDLRLGPQSQEPAGQEGDFVLQDAQGQWTYQHCVVADDIAEGITLVIRGEDILDSTGRQLQLFRALGHPAPPRYLHHPLVTDASGKKLSKKEFAKSLGDLRREGWTAERVFGEAAYLGGLVTTSSPIAANDLRTLFAV